MNPYIVFVFQFHKGAIKTSHATLRTKRDKGFNSIKVRLKHIKALCDKINSLFQFHKGAIKTVAQVIRDEVRSVSIP